MSPNQANNKPHQVGYQEGHRISTEAYSSVRGTEEDRIFDRDQKEITIKDCFMGIETDCDGNPIFPF